MVDFIVRDCGRVGFLPLIEAELNGETHHLYRGEHHATKIGAFIELEEVWEAEEVSNVRSWKEGRYE